MPSCHRCSTDFVIHPAEEKFLGKIGFTFGTVTVNPPLPVHCPDCRAQIRTCHRNEQYLYKTVSAKTGKEIVSLYAPKPVSGNKPYAVYEQEEWKSERWDPLSYGKDFDASRPFFEQYGELQRIVPKAALITLNNENSDYTTGTGFCKNCYLINSSEYCEDCYYGKLLQKCKNSVDCSYLFHSELCHENFSVYDSYGCQSLFFSQNCTDCFFSSNLNGCKNCCLCTNLVRKEYCFLNEQLTKEEYEKRLKEFQGDAERTAQVRKLLGNQMQKMVRKYANIVNSENCTGDYIENSQNCLDCYDMTESQDCRYVQVGVTLKDGYDSSNIYVNTELCYQTLGTIEAYNVAYCLFVFNCQRMLYCEQCYSCSDCFACVGLMRRKYCIFNKQYSKEDYEALVPKIIEHMKKTKEWGQFFPPSLSPFGYNESLASEYFPLSQEEAVTRGFLWREKDEKEYRPQSAEVPSKIQDVKDGITQETLACEDCGKNYKIVPQELAFYRKQIIPLPRRCPECRHRARMALRNPRKLWDRQCAQCKKHVASTYAPDRSETIFCEECYVAAVH